MRGLPFYVKREAFARADTRQRVAYILSAVLVITMLCVIFRFSAADATHSSHLSEGVCIRLVRELNSVFPEQFPKEKLVKVAEAIEYPIRKCAHFTEYAVLGITVNLYLWMCYRMEMLLSRKKKAKDIQRTEEKLQKTVKQKAVVQENVLPEIRNIKEKVTAQESATQETEIARQTVENTEQKMELSIWNFIIRAEIFCALYACSDEFHQYFVPGRSCKFFDVCVDSTGTFFGALLFWGIFHLREQKRERKRRMQQFKERTQTNVVCDGCRNRVAFSSGRGRNLAAANSYSGPGADRGDDRGKNPPCVTTGRSPCGN